MKHYIVNVAMKVHGTLNEAHDLIDLFKELNSEECVESTSVKNTVGQSHGLDDNTYTKHGKNITFRLRFPFVMDGESDLRGYPINPFKAVGKCFGEFVRYRKTSAEVVEKDIELTPDVLGAHQKLMSFPWYASDLGLSQRWGKDKPVGIN